MGGMAVGKQLHGAQRFLGLAVLEEAAADLAAVLRVALAAALFGKPDVLLLDEPTAGLDLGSREEIMQMLGYFAGNPSAPAIIMVTHHVEEIPRGFTHVLLVKDGGAAYTGPIASTLTSDNLTDVFGVKVTVYNNDGRYSAQASL